MPFFVVSSDSSFSMLSVDGGQVSVDGTVDSMVYEDDQRTGGSFLSRLFG